MGRESARRGLLGLAVASVFVLTPSVAVIAPTNTNTLRGLQSVVAGTPAPAGAIGEVPTPAPIVTPELAPDTTCSNGFPGVESANGKTCCMAYCIECAGVGCSNRGNSSDCCATEIAVESQDCDVAGEAPCFITPPEPWAPEHTLVYFAYFVIIPFIVLAILCNYSLLPCFREKADPSDPATTEHLHGHNIGSRVTPPSSTAPTRVAKTKPPPVEADGASTL
eukprot:g10205.t1